jgi:hypothetical protein
LHASFIAPMNAVWQAHPMFLHFIVEIRV